MKKKVISVVMSLALALAVITTPAFAEDYVLPGDPDPTTNDALAGASTQDVDIPVFGYVGEDADVTDPEDPIFYEINVSVPVALMWAAFETDGGAIVAPVYTIENRSAKNLVKVELTSFEGDGADNAAVDSVLTLNIKSITGTFNQSGVVVAGAYGINDAPKGTMDVRSAWTFTFDGTWAGNFSDGPFSPTYKMVLTFTLDN